MRYRVTLQRPVNEDVRRGIPQQWEDVTQVWASIRPNKTAETSSGPKKVVVGEYEIRTYTFGDLDETWRIKHGDTIYNIIQVDEPIILLKESIILAKRDKQNAKD